MMITSCFSCTCLDLSTYKQNETSAWVLDATAKKTMGIGLGLGCYHETFARNKKYIYLAIHSASHCIPLQILFKYVCRRGYHKSCPN